MRPFDELTQAGQTRRLSAWGRRVLVEEYGLRPVRLRVQPPTFNRLVRVELADGRTVALRIGAATRIHPPQTEAIEARWLTRLADHPEIGAPRPIPAASGATSVRLADHRLDLDRVASVFTWLPGRRPSRAMGPRPARQLGALAARLHDQAPEVTIPTAWQRACQADHPVTFAPRDGLSRWSDPRQGLVLDAQQRCREAIDALWRWRPHPPHLLHGDLGPNNVVSDGQRLRPVDFQDLLWGFTIQDLAITLADFRRRGAADATIASFRRGYTAVRPWPEADREVWAALDAARSLSLLNLALTLRRDGYRTRVDRHASDLHRWMTRGD